MAWFLPFGFADMAVIGGCGYAGHGRGVPEKLVKSVAGLRQVRQDKKHTEQVQKRIGATNLCLKRLNQRSA